MLDAICKDKGGDIADADAMIKLCEHNEDAKLYWGKVNVARFYAQRSLSQCKAKAAVLKSGDKSPLDMVF